MNERVYILREAVTRLTKLLAGKKVEVTQRGTRAYVEYTLAGQPKRVNLPYIPDNASEDLINAIQGFLDHEVGHILFSDFELLAKGIEEGVGNLHNVLEDTFIERQMMKKFRGSGMNLTSTSGFYLNHFAKPELAKATAEGDVKRMIGILMVPAIRAWSGQEIHAEFMRDKLGILEPVVKRLGSLIGDIAKCNSTADTLALAHKINRALEESPAPESPSKEGKEKPEKPEKKDEIEEPDEKPDDEQSEDKGDGESSDGSGAKNEDEDEGEDKDEGEGDEGDEGEEPPGERGAGADDSPENASEEESEESGVSLTGIEGMLSDDFDSAVAEVLSKVSVKAAESSDYLVYTKDFDKIEPLPTRGFSDFLLSRLEDKTLHMAGPLQKDLERAIAARSMKVWQGGLRRGRINGASLARLATGDDRIFRRRQEHRGKDAAVELVVDCSGSMDGVPIELATQAAYALSTVLDRMGIANEVIGFTTLSIYGRGAAGPSDEEVQEDPLSATGKQYSRFEPIYMPVIKGFDERMNSTVKQRFAVLPAAGCFRNNIDGESIEIAAMRLMQRREKGKIMIVLSDGEPAACGESAEQYSHLLRTTKKIEAAGINLIGLGIDSAAVTRFYSKSIVIRKIEELPGEVMRQLKGMLLGSMQ